MLQQLCAAVLTTHIPAREPGIQTWVSHQMLVMFKSPHKVPLKMHPHHEVTSAYN